MVRLGAVLADVHDEWQVSDRRYLSEVEHRALEAVPGRKSDVRDAEWIVQPWEHGLLAPSFVAPPETPRLQMLTRTRCN